MDVFEFLARLQPLRVQREQGALEDCGDVAQPPEQQLEQEIVERNSYDVEKNDIYNYELYSQGLVYGTSD